MNDICSDGINATSGEKGPFTVGYPETDDPQARNDGGEITRFRCISQLQGFSLLKARFVSFSYAPHSHDTFAIGQTLQGFQDFRCQEKEYRSYPGAVITINPGDVHDGHAGMQSGFAYRMLYVPVSFYASLAEEVWGCRKDQCSFPGALHEDRTTSTLAARIFRVLSDPGASLLEIHSVVTQNLAVILQRHGELKKDPKTCASRVKNIQDARDYIRDNAACNVTLEDLATRFDDTHYMFLRRFRKVVGMPPHRFQIQCRVDRAKSLMAGGASLSEAAQDAGFCDQSHLNRRFKEVCGISPGAYLSAVRGSPS